MSYLVQPEVPYISQKSPTECWYASLRMVLCHRYGPTPAYGLPDVAKGNKGLPMQEYERFALENGLVGVRKQTSAEKAYNQLLHNVSRAGTWSMLQLEMLLKNHGPLWVSYTAHVGAHIVVLVGTEGLNVVYHDPQLGPNRRVSLET